METKVVSFLGFERCDMLVYLLNEVRTKNLKILVIDNSFKNDFFNSLNRADEEADCIEAGRVLYMRNKTVSREDAEVFKKFDVIFLYHGMNINYEMVDFSDYMVIQTDYRPSTIEQIETMLDMEVLNSFPRDKSMLVLRDKVSSKVSTTTIKRALGIAPTYFEYVLPYDKEDYAMYLNYCYNGSQATAGASDEMKSAVKTMAKWFVAKKGGVA